MTDKTSTNGAGNAPQTVQISASLCTEIRCLNSLEKNRETLEAFVAAAISERLDRLTGRSEIELLHQLDHGLNALETRLAKTHTAVMETKSVAEQAVHYAHQASRRANALLGVSS